MREERAASLARAQQITLDRARCRKVAYDNEVSESERFRRDVGLDQDFKDARRRWSSLSTTKRAAPRRDAALQQLRERLERELVEAQALSDSEFDAARNRLNVLSPWYAPPTDREVIATRAEVTTALAAVTRAINTFERQEKLGVAWYSDRGEVPGIERPLVDQFGPGNAMRGEHDPVPLLLVCRDLLTKYLARLEAARPLGDPKMRKQIVQSVAETLLGGSVATKDICAVLASKGIDVTPHAIDLIASKLRKARGATSRPTRGGAPRGRRNGKRLPPP